MPELSSAEFNEFLRATVLQEISLWESNVVRTSSQIGPQERYQWGENASLLKSDDRAADILATFGIRIMDGEIETARLELTLKLAYETPTPMTDAMFDQFCKITLRIHAGPFAREWFRDTSSRMGIKPILLPIAFVHPAGVPNEKMASVPTDNLEAKTGKKSKSKS